jgi:hypothetical protein
MPAVLLPLVVPGPVVTLLLDVEVFATGPAVVAADVVSPVEFPPAVTLPPSSDEVFAEVVSAGAVPPAGTVEPLLVVDTSPVGFVTLLAAPVGTNDVAPTSV